MTPAKTDDQHQRHEDKSRRSGEGNEALDSAEIAGRIGGGPG